MKAIQLKLWNSIGVAKLDAILFVNKEQNFVRIYSKENNPMDIDIDSIIELYNEIVKEKSFK